MLFSIIIPVYNVEQYLNRCLDSIINQTEQDFEVILINDGSTDNSAKICDDYADRFPGKILAYHYKNQGVLLARREGISKAKGDYFLFLDSDDYIRQDALEVINNKIRNYKCDVVIFDFLIILYDGTELLPKFPYANNELVSDRDLIFRRFINREMKTVLWNKVISRTLIDFESNYGEFSFMNFSEDLFQLIPIIAKAENILFINENLLIHCKNKAGLGAKKYLKPDVRTEPAIAERMLIAFPELDDECQRLLQTEIFKRYYDVALNICSNKCKLKWSKKIELLDIISCDEFFREAYNSISLDINDSELKRIALLLYECKSKKLLDYTRRSRFINPMKRAIKKATKIFARKS